MTHEKPAMPEEIWVNREPDNVGSFYGSDNRLHQSIKDCRTKYIRADLASTKAEAGDSWETCARRLSCQTLSESDALWSPEQWYKKMIAAWHK